jgi:hypothetical protein
MRCMGSTGRHAGSSRTGARDAHVSRLDLRAEIAAARACSVANAAEAYTTAGERVHSRPVLPTMGTQALMCSHQEVVNQTTLLRVFLIASL